MKRLSLAAATFAALVACSSQPSTNGPPPGSAAPQSGNSTRDTPPQTAPLERPTNPY